MHIYNYIKIINLCINIGSKKRKGNKGETIDFTIILNDYITYIQ